MQWLANERFFGTYRRQLSLGEGIDASAISATYENGVLTVTIPLAERAKPRKIEVAQAAASSRSSRPPSIPSSRIARLRADRESVEYAICPQSRRAQPLRSSRYRRLLRTAGHSMSRIE